MQCLRMRNQAVLVLLLSLFAVTLSRDLHKRDADLEGDVALLDAFARAFEEGKLVQNARVQDVGRNMMKRWFLSGSFPTYPGNVWPGKK